MCELLYTCRLIRKQPIEGKNKAVQPMGLCVNLFNTVDPVGV